MSRDPGRISDTRPEALYRGPEVVASPASGPLPGGDTTIDAEAEEEVTGQRIVPPPPLPQRAARAPSNADAFAVRGLRSRLVGRERELTEMAEALARAVDFQAPQLITVVGNQGTGKSRLIAELIERHAGDPIRVFTGRALPPGDLAAAGDGSTGDGPTSEVGRGGPRYGVIQQLLRDRFSITDGEPEQECLARFTTEVESVFGDGRIAEVLHFLGLFLDLNLPDSPFLRVLGESQQQHDEIMRTVLRRFFEVDAQRSPLVLVFDDLQWADEDSLKILRELGAGLGGSPVALIAAARPELLVRFAEWGTGTTDHLRIDLRNLEPDDAAVMMGNLLSRCDRIAPEIIDDAVEMTGGNPHFLEQLVRLFLDNGTIDARAEPWRLDPERAAATELPISIEEAIEARVAALEGEERDALEKGAVFGNVFWLGAVVALTRVENALADAERDAPAAPDATLADGTGTRARRAPGADSESLDWTDEGEPVRARVIEVLDDLVDRDYLLKLDSEDSTVLGDVELVFKHNLERELITRSTEARRLARYHRLAAQWLETKLSARSEEQLEFLAQLYERGGDPDRAAHCYLAGADKAMGRYANEQAVDLYRKALAMLDPEDPVARLSALHNLGSVLDLIGRTDEAHHQFTEMLRMAWLFDQKAKGGAAHSRLGRIYRRRGEFDRAMDHLHAANELFTQAVDRRGIAGTLDDIGKVHWLRGEYAQALEFHRQALAIRRALGDRRSIALSLANIGRVHNDSGAFKAANRQFREALDLRRDIGDMSGVVQSLCDLGGVHTADGSYEMALEMFVDAHKIAEEIGDKLAQSEVLSRLGECKAAMGRGSEAVEHLLEAISLATALGHKAAVSECCRRLAEVHIGMGDANQAYDYARRALAIGEEVGTRAHVGTAHRVLAEALCAAGLVTAEQTHRADEHFRRAVDILAAMKNELELARCYRSYAMLCEHSGQMNDAVKLRQRAEEIFGRLRGAASIE